MASHTSKHVVASSIRHVYRELLHLSKQQQHQQQSLQELRTKFREPLLHSETTETHLEEAQKRLSFLRITTTKVKPRGQAGRWVYKDGERFEHVDGTLRNDKGRVHTNWDGKNLDPESVSYHFKNLKRAGFVNNLHAKGIF